MTPRSLYLHIPFCQHKCLYCDFNTYAGLEHLIPEYLTALGREIAAWGAVAGDPAHPVETIFFGGGTPSLVPPAGLGGLVEACRVHFGLVELAEVTAEANPASFRQLDLAGLRSAGINRLSFGAQSFQPELLTFLERLHGPDEIGDSVRRARLAGFDNLSLDLIYGLPYQTLAQWADDLDRALDLGTDHLSLYCLTVEKKTPLFRQVQQGQVPEPDPDLAADMYDLAVERLAEAGFAHYEISNWARLGLPEGPAPEASHNLTYWRNQPYLGFGPGAHSSLGGWRFWNLDSPRAYLRVLNGGGTREPAGERPPFAPPAVRPLLAGEAISPELTAAETMILGLRLAEGIDRAGFAARFGQDPLDRWAEVVAELVDWGLLTVSDETIRLIDRAWIVGNEVFCRFLPEGPAPGE